MPEGPSLIIARDTLQWMIGKKITATTGNASIDMEKLRGKRIVDIRTWGKRLFICLDDCTIAIHFLMFGSYNVGPVTKPSKSLRLQLKIGRKLANFYTCSVKIIEDDLETLYDWEANVMSDRWKPAKARKKLKTMPREMVCDVLLDQEVFSGVGNIIKNEVLYRIRVHPESRVAALPATRLGALIKEARKYSSDFLEWKKEFVLRKNWLAHTKRTCIRCDLPIIKKYCGKTKRRTFFCRNCQHKYK